MRERTESKEAARDASRPGPSARRSDGGDASPPSPSAPTAADVPEFEAAEDQAALPEAHPPPAAASPAALPEDAELAEAARDGDSEAFRELIRRFAGLVYRVAFAKTGDAHDAEDLAQEIFLHAHTSIGRLREPHAFVSWLLAIAHRRGNRFLRTRMGRRRVLDEFREIRRLEAERGERARRWDAPHARGVSEVVTGLPEEFRLALTWKYIDGLSYEEIGARLSLSFNQVDYLLRRAKKTLRRRLERDRPRPEGR